jgi:hypothetical protein
METHNQITNEATDEIVEEIIDLSSPNPKFAQLLAGVLPFEDLQTTVLTNLTWFAHEYVWFSQRDPGLQQAAFCMLIWAAYDLSLVFEANLDLYDTFEGRLFKAEDRRKEPGLSNIFATILDHAFSKETRRWRERAAKIAKGLSRVSHKGLDPDELVTELERVMAHDNFG